MEYLNFFLFCQSNQLNNRLFNVVQSTYNFEFMFIKPISVIFLISMN